MLGSVGVYFLKTIKRCTHLSGILDTDCQYILTHLDTPMSMVVCRPRQYVLLKRAGYLAYNLSRHRYHRGW